MLVPISGDNILSVSKAGLLYKDEEAVVRWFEFKGCNKRWLESRDDVSDWDRRCVGQRGLDGQPDSVIEFFTEPKITFEFESYEQAYDSLLVPMRERGDWYIYDAV